MCDLQYVHRVRLKGISVSKKDNQNKLANLNILYEIDKLIMMWNISLLSKTESSRLAQEQSINFTCSRKIISVKKWII